MWRHEFEPGKLIAGLALLGACVLHVMDATGRWEVPPAALLVPVPAGLFLAGGVAALTYGLRHRSAHRTPGGPPGSGWDTADERPPAADRGRPDRP